MIPDELAYMDTSQCTSAPNRESDLALGGTHGACPWKTWTIRTVLQHHTRLTETRLPCILHDALFGPVSFGGLWAPTQAMIPHYQPQRKDYHPVTGVL